MKTVIFVFAIMSFSTAVNTDEPQSPFKWILSSPSGAVYKLYGEETQFSMNEPGGWLIHLTTYYAHTTPTGEPYTHTTSETMIVKDNPVFIFSDGFEATAPLNRWTTTQGGQE